MIIRTNDDVFFLQTKDTSYIFKAYPMGHLKHLYYGSRLEDTIHINALLDEPACSFGNMNSYSADNQALTLESACLEMSSYGKGDVREPFISLIHGDGSRTSDFVYVGSEIKAGKSSIEGMPSSYGDDDEVSELRITLKDKQYDEILTLVYCVFEDTNIITRRAIYENCSDSVVCVNRIMSNQLDIADYDYDFITFGGTWTREMNMHHQNVSHGKLVNSTVAGVSSSRSNPFTMVARKHTTEEAGECYGFNLVYSGNHYTSIETDGFGRTRFVSGINPDGFSFMVEPGASFETPEAVMTYSGEGFRKLSQNMHTFVRNNIVRGPWKDRERPVLLNSWEAAYFDIDEGKLMKMAKAGKDVGIELFVVDDGWFEGRNDDTSSLGDWIPDKKKLPGGLKSVADKIHSLGMDFGIWVEPEMVNVNSLLYKEHPDWAICIPGKPHSEGRHQMLLDLTRKETCDYIIMAMESVLSSADINFVKWDMNRIFSDVYSSALPPEKQGEVYHRYVLGLYAIVKQITEKFPNILFEGCASGGNRFDLGMLCFMPQIWASDNTDAISRATIQTGYSYGYPQSVLGCHVSGCPNHQTLRNTSLATRFNVAAFGVLGYECNISEMTSEERDEIRTQIEFYKRNRRLFQFGDFYRMETGEKTPYSNGQYKWVVALKDGNKAIGMFLQSQVMANIPFAVFKGAGLNKDKIYSFKNIRYKYNIKEFGDLINTVAPIHVKKDSIVHNTIARFVKMDNEIEDVTVPGDILMKAGVRLKDAYTGVGYNENIRLFKDYESRLYIMESCDHI